MTVKVFVSYNAEEKKVIGPNIYSNHDVIRGAGVFDEVTGNRL